MLIALNAAGKPIYGRHCTIAAYSVSLLFPAFSFPATWAFICVSAPSEAKTASISSSLSRTHCTRACLKKHSCHLYNDAYASYSPLCVIFAPNSGYIARYAPFIWHKSPTNCDAHLAESIFQTRSRQYIQMQYHLCYSRNHPVLSP